MFEGNPESGALDVSHPGSTLQGSRARLDQLEASMLILFTRRTLAAKL
jgi:hypothetical protein